MKKFKLFTSVLVLAATIGGFSISTTNAMEKGIQTNKQLSLENHNHSLTMLVTESGNTIKFGNPRIQQESKQLSQFRNKRVDEGLDFHSQKVKDTIVQTINVDKSKLTIEIPFEFQDGEYIKLAEDENGNTSGAGNIFNKENESIALLLTPQIENREDVKYTATVKEGNILEIQLESETNQPTSIEVAATATSYSTYFNSGSWIQRDWLTLSMNHKPYLTGANGNFESITRKLDSWDKLKARHSSSSNWKNTSGMEDQYYCHFDTIGAYKNPWNLEPARPYVGYYKTVLAGCNPE